MYRHINESEKKSLNAQLKKFITILNLNKWKETSEYVSFKNFEFDDINALKKISSISKYGKAYLETLFGSNIKDIISQYLNNIINNLDFSDLTKFKTLYINLIPILDIANNFYDLKFTYKNIDIDTYIFIKLCKKFNIKPSTMKTWYSLTIKDEDEDEDDYEYDLYNITVFFDTFIDFLSDFNLNPKFVNGDCLGTESALKDDDISKYFKDENTMILETYANGYMNDMNCEYLKHITIDSKQILCLKDDWYSSYMGCPNFILILLANSKYNAENEFISNKLELYLNHVAEELYIWDGSEPECGFRNDNKLIFQLPEGIGLLRLTPKMLNLIMLLSI